MNLAPGVNAGFPLHPPHYGCLAGSGAIAEGLNPFTISHICKCSISFSCLIGLCYQGYPSGLRHVQAYQTMNKLQAISIAL